MSEQNLNMHLPEGWEIKRLEGYLTESRISGSRGDTAKKITVKLYGKGAFGKLEKRAGSANTSYFIRKAGQFIYSKLDFLNGAFAILPKELDGFESTLDLPTFDISDKISPNWLLVYITRKEFYKSFLSGAVGSRKARRVSQEEFLSASVLFPPLLEQQRISRVLQSVDVTLEAARETQAQAQRLREMVMQNLLTRGKKSKLGDLTIKGGLQTGPFGSQLHASDYTISGVPVVMPKDLSEGFISESRIARVPQAIQKKLTKHNLQLGDVVFSRRGKLERFAVITEREKGWICGTGCIRARFSQAQILPKYIFYYLQKPEISIWLNENAVGQTMPNLNTSILEQLPLMLPPLPEQQRIVSILETFDQRLSAASAYVCQLEQLKKKLLQALLTGQVRVPMPPKEKP